MKLRKIVFALTLVLFATSFGFAADDVKPVVAPKTSETPVSARGQELVNRLEEIKAMDIESMSRSEKRKLRREVRSIEKEMREINDGGVYISVGGIIIILLLLILLL
jgi:hypothetical protein